MKKLLILFAFILISIGAYAQNNMRDVVYLKNGGITKGIIIEQVPNQSLKIQTADGSVFVYKFSEIERISKEGIQPDNSTGMVTPNYGVQSGLIERNRGNICYVNGRTLTDNEVLALVGQDRFETYVGGRAQRTMGKSFTTWGWVDFGVGTGLWIAGLALDSYALYYSGLLCLTTADILLPVGYVFRGIGSSRINWVCNDYNEQKNHASLRISPSLMRLSATSGTGSQVAIGATVSLMF